MDPSIISGLFSIIASLTEENKICDENENYSLI